MNKLFKTEQVKKFFKILDRLDRCSQEHYKGHSGGEDFSPCQQDVFVARTIKRWFSGKFYKQLEAIESGFSTYNSNSWDSKPILSEQIRLICVIGINFYYGYSNAIEINFLDASKPSKFNNSFKITHNSALSLFAEEISGKKYNEIASIFKVESLKCVECDDKTVLHKDNHDDKQLCDKCRIELRNIEIEAMVEERMKSDKKKV